MRRRDTLGFLCALTAAGIASAHSEQGRRIGILWPFAEDEPEGRALFAAFRQRLRDLGWTDLQIDSRWDGADVERARSYAGDIVRSEPDVIFAYFNAQLSALARETRTIPIIFVGASDPVGAGYVESLPRPGGNITGFTLYEPSLAGKWLAVLREVAPALKRVSLLVNPGTAILRGRFYTRTLEAAARAVSVEPAVAEVHGPADIDTVYEALGKDAGNGVIVAPDTFSEANGDRIVALAAQHRVPTVFAIRRFAYRGGLMSYGPDTFDAVARAAAYVDRVLRGEKPAVLPVQAPTKFELIVNLKVAKALGLTVTSSLLAQADEIVE
jgi:putative tryptophan/tyrosine transport system substrate-binding protein